MPFGFEVIIASPPEYERLTAEIFFDGKFVALVSHERQEGIFDLETPGLGLDEDQIVRRVEVEGFVKAVASACESLRCVT